MNAKDARSKVRRPVGSQPARLAPGATSSAAGAAGGPQTRGQSSLGRVLADLLAYFEVRTVTTLEVDLVRPTHENGWLRPQIEAKLAQLHPTCPDHCELRRLVTLSLDLLTAVDEGRFVPGQAWAHVEPRLLRALAYFVQEADAIPDHLPQGYDDDMREFRQLAQSAGDLFAVFEVLDTSKISTNSQPRAR
jgi:hypothetical protein